MQIISLFRHHGFIRYKYLLLDIRKQFKGGVTEKLLTPVTKTELNAHTIKVNHYHQHCM